MVRSSTLAAIPFRRVDIRDLVVAVLDPAEPRAVRPGHPEVHTNTVEGFYSIFKRGMKGVYQHCGKQHLHRYAAEFDFRYNHRAAHSIDDLSRADLALRGVVGKRLTYAQ